MSDGDEVFKEVAHAQDARTADQDARTHDQDARSADHDSITAGLDIRSDELDARADEQDAESVHLQKESVILQDAFLLFAGEVKGLRQVIEKSYVSAQEAAARDQKSKRRGRVALAAAIIALIFAGSGSWFSAQASYGNRDVVERFDDCVNPGTEENPHECFDDSQARTQEFVRDIHEDGLARDNRLVDGLNEFFQAVDPSVPELILPPAPDSQVDQDDDASG